MDLALIEKLIEAYDSGVGSAIATIIKSWGSTPRKTGAKMLITGNGSVLGTVGGGSGEAGVQREALKVLAQNRPAKLSINMANDAAANDGMVCGGKMEVFIDTVTPEDSAAREIFGQLLESLKNGKGGVLFTITSDRGMGQELVGKKFFFSGEKVVSHQVPDDITAFVKSLHSQGRGRREAAVLTCTAEIEKRLLSLELLAEPVALPEDLLILGGGHVAVPLARMAEIVGYRYKIVDDRPEFADRERFPGAEAVICQGFEKALAGLDIGPNTSVVIITRGHAHDRLCLREVLKKQAFYIGMIGSRRKVQGVLESLRDEGIEEERLRSVFSPIGLDIGAETPEEIALSIMSEIVAVRRGGGGRSMKLQRGF
ncbi:MAG: XdhC family protein [Bacillota bacterium]